MAALQHTVPKSIPALAAATAEVSTHPRGSSYGSGYFGRWTIDSFGLPAYHYTCNQTTDPKAVLPVNEAWRSKTDHIHQIGNDRLVAVVSNYGHVQVRQDEGSPKFLNDYAPAQHRFGGGIGFLSDGDFVLSTYYPGGAESFERFFGSGYLRKQISGHQYDVDQVIFAPFGDDPVLVSQVTITNRSNTPARPRWTEYWGSRQYQFSYRALMEASIQGSADAAPQMRRDLSGRFGSHFERIRQAGLLLHQSFSGRTPEEEASWRKVQTSLHQNPDGYFGGTVPPLAPGASMEDLTPPVTFLISLDAPVDSFATDAEEFFRGGIRRPLGASVPLNNAAESNSAERAFFLQRELDMKSGQSQTLYFLYGYLPEGFDLDALIAKYSASPSSLLSNSSEKWKASGIALRVESEPWVEREVAWSGCCLRSALTYDSFFREHILSQGAGYQYLAGLQGAARDPLQHALPFIFTDPEVVRGILRYTLKEIQPDGSIPYGIVGAGVPMPCRYQPSDLELWLLWVASEYVLATRDTSFLEERIQSYPQHGSPRKQETVLDLLAHCYRHLTETIGTGEHGLQRIYNGDWNDSIVVNRFSPEQVAEVVAHGESVLNSAMATWVFEEYAQLLNYLGKPGYAEEVKAEAAAQREAVRRQWTGRWFRRAWLGRDLGWCGKEQLWLEPQPWALLGGCATDEQARNLIRSIDEMSRRPSPIGALLQSPADPTMKDEPGTGTNGGIFAAINATLIWALATVDGSMAWDEWKKNTLARHADVYPDDWFGIWSGPDAYDSILAKHPGSTAPDFPVLNMHSHAWPLYTATKLFGLEFDEHGLVLRPVLPAKAYNFSSSLFGLRKSAPARYTGWYEPRIAGRWQVQIELPREELSQVREVVVNSTPSPPQSSQNRLTFTGMSAPGQPLRWELR